MKLLSIIQLTVFSIGTIFLIYISRKSLRSFKAHGFYRFFVFEFTLALVLLNIPYWFTDSFSFPHIVSWIVLCISLLFIIQSLYFIRKYGGSGKRENYSSNFEFENTITLVKEGIYKYIRHPMYSSLLFLAWGAALKQITIVNVLLAVLSSIYIILTARAEEQENIRFFGFGYEEYMKKTKMFIPFII